MSTIKVDTIQNSVGENLIFENKNLLINGGMNIFQRSTSQASVTATGYYTADRWRLATNLGTFTQSRSTDVPSAQGFGYSLKMDCTTADASPTSNKFLIIQQKIEGQNLQHLLKGSSSSKAVTLSFWVKSNKTGTYVIEIDHETASRSISKSYTISSANTWEKKVISFDGDTSSTIANDNAIGLSILWWLGGGSNFTSGSLGTSWASTTDANRAVGQVNLADSTSNEWYLTGCQLEIGSKATEFEFEPFETVFRKCQRYFYSQGGESAYNHIGSGYCTSSTACWINFTFPTRLRTTPTYTFSSTSHFQLSNGSHNASPTNISNNQSGTHRGSISVPVSSGATNGRGAALMGKNIDMRFKTDAEL